MAPTQLLDDVACGTALTRVKSERRERIEYIFLRVERLDTNVCWPQYQPYFYFYTFVRPSNWRPRVHVQSRRKFAQQGGLRDVETDSESWTLLLPCVSSLKYGNLPPLVNGSRNL